MLTTLVCALVSAAALGSELPEQTEIDLLRGANRARIFVQATLPNGELGLFLVDTGADISVIHRSVADDLSLEVQENWGMVQGLSGSASMDRAVIPQISLNGAVVEDIEVAVGVPGLQERHEFMPLAGILGNNVWSNFVLELDYPADLMVLHRPGTRKIPKKAEILLFDGSHILTPIEITTRAENPHTDEIVIEVDTGASNLLLSGATGLPFEQDYTEGLEPVWGIGASETLPPYRFLQRTRRIPLEQVKLGGRTVKVQFEARWLNFATDNPIGPTGMRGLAGHELLAGHNVLIDYQGHRFLLQKSRRKKRSVNGHQVLLDQDIARYGNDDARLLYRAQLQAGLGEYEETVKALDAYLASHPDDAEARVLLTRLHRALGDLDKAWLAANSLTPGGLVDEGEIVAAVNGLLLEGQHEDALSLAAHAIEARPEEGDAYVARADALLAVQQYEAARLMLLDAARLVENPDAHLLRRARIAMATGDRHGSMAHVRKLLQLYPSGGSFLWFYSMLIDGTDEAETFRVDMLDAMQRLHPHRRPLDFMVAAHASIGDTAEAVRLMEEGIDRDCPAGSDNPDRLNCVAWYWSLARQHPEESLEHIERALEIEGDRSDYLDTKAMVHLARDEFYAAHGAAVSAARLSPEDVYMLWQAERIGALVEKPPVDDAETASGASP